MTPSEEVQKLLDERGIEHFDHGHENHVWWCGADNVGWHAENRPSVNGSFVKIEAVLTPAQAIAATVGRRDTMELWPEWEQVLFANVTDEVAQDNLNECVHELLEKAATVGRSCESCPEMDNPDSYIRHLQSALRWHDEHVPRPTNPRNTCVVLQGEKPPEEVLFIHEDGSGVMHYLPDDAGTCTIVKTWTDSDYADHWRYSCSECGYQIEVGERDMATGNPISHANFCWNCGRKVIGIKGETE